MVPEQKEMRMNFVKILFLAGAVFAAAHCGNAGIYDEATATYYRVVRSGLNEWYPLNGNLSSRVGSVDGTATAAYSAGANRAAEGGKAVCTTSARMDFSPNTFGATPFTISAWVKFNSLTAGPNAILQRGTPQTGYLGFQLSQTGSTSVPMLYGNGSFSTNSTGPALSAGEWYFLAFANTGTAGTLYVGKYGGTLTTVGPTSGNYAQYTLTAFQIFVSAVDACADDLLHYNRVLSADEVKQNFLSME